MDLLREKILSIMGHITNQHTFPLNNEHKMCTHPTLSEDGRDKPWLRADSVVRKNLSKRCCSIQKNLQFTIKAVKKVKQAILGHENCRIKELDHMLGFTHTGLIESWNALNNKYANKNYYYRL